MYYFLFLTTNKMWPRLGEEEIERAKLETKDINNSKLKAFRQVVKVGLG